MKKLLTVLLSCLGLSVQAANPDYNISRPLTNGSPIIGLGGGRMGATNPAAFRALIGISTNGGDVFLAADNVFTGTSNYFPTLAGSNITAVMLAFHPESAPGAPTVAINAAAGNLNGAYYYRVVFRTAMGVTEPGAVSAVVSPVSQQVNLSSIPLGSTNVVSRLIYRTIAGGVYVSGKLAATINDNTTTTLTDNVADASLGANFQGWNSTGGIISNRTARIVNDSWLTAIGSEAGKSNSGPWNVFIGRESGEENTVGYANTMAGDSTFLFNTNGSYNNGFGQGALANNLLGNGNTAIGFHALAYNLYSHESVAVGNGALEFSTEGENIAIGTRAGGNLVQGSRNIIIGDDVDAPLPNFNEQLNIGNLIFGTGLNGTGTNVSNTGKIGIRSPAPDAQFEIMSDGQYATAATSQLLLRGETTPAKQMRFGLDIVKNYGYVQVITDGVGYLPLLLNPDGANVGVGTVGTNMPTTQLQVSRTVNPLPTSDVYGQLEVTDSAATATARRLAIGYSSTYDAGYLQSIHNGTAFKPLLLNPQGGNVGVNTNAAGTAFDVVGVVKANGFQIGAAAIDSWDDVTNFFTQIGGGGVAQTNISYTAVTNAPWGLLGGTNIWTGTNTFGTMIIDTLLLTTPNGNFWTNLTGDPTAYGASWNSNTNVPTKNSVYDKIESIALTPTFTNSNFYASDGNTTNALTVWNSGIRFSGTSTTFPVVGNSINSYENGGIQFVLSGTQPLTFSPSGGVNIGRGGLSTIGRGVLEVSNKFYLGPTSGGIDGTNQMQVDTVAAARALSVGTNGNVIAAGNIQSLSLNTTGAGANGMDSLIVTNTINARTNIGSFDVVTNDFVIGTRYTNSTRRSFVAASFQLSAAAAGTAAVTFSVEQSGVTNKLTVSAGPLASLITVEPLMLPVGPGAFYYFTDGTSGVGGAATIVSGTSSRTDF